MMLPEIVTQDFDLLEIALKEIEIAFFVCTFPAAAYLYVLFEVMVSDM